MDLVVSVEARRQAYIEGWMKSWEESPYSTDSCSEAYAKAVANAAHHIKDED